MAVPPHTTWESRRDTDCLTTVEPQKRPHETSLLCSIEKAEQSLPAERIRGFIPGHNNVIQESYQVISVHARSHECETKVGNEKHGGIKLSLAWELTTFLEPEFTDREIVPGP